MRKFILFLSISFFTLSTMAQEEYGAGYIVKNSGDTIRGKLKIETDEKLREGVYFEGASGTNRMTVESIKGFGIDGVSIFRKLSYADPLDSGKYKSHFAKCLFDGENGLFAFMSKDKRYFILQSADTTCLLFDDLKTNNGELLERGNFRNQLYFISRNCEKVSSRIELMQYSESSFLDVFTNLAKCNGQFKESQVLYKKPKMIRQVIIYAGAMAIPERYDFAFQATMRFILPSESKKTSLNVGLAYSYNFRKTPYEPYIGLLAKYDRRISGISVPVFIQYNILNGRIQPYVYGGTGLIYKTETVLISDISSATYLESRFGVLILGGAGVEAILSKNWMVKLDWRYDISPHIPVLGIAYRFVK